MTPTSVLNIVAYGAWNGGKLVDNSIYEQKGLSFKGGIPVTNQTIEERIGVRTRKTAGTDERIGVSALQDLLDTSDIDLSRIKLVIGATNVGDDKVDPGPLIRHPYRIIREYCPEALVFDLYAGCPGFNVSVELNLMLSLSGFLKAGDISIIIGAENIHRAQSFKPNDTANIIFGDDALATALETRNSSTPQGQYIRKRSDTFRISHDFVSEIAEKINELCINSNLDGIIIDNQLGNIIYRVPATAARVQHALVELMYPEQTAQGTFQRFKGAIGFYDQHVQSFAYDIMTLDANAAHGGKNRQSICRIRKMQKRGIRLSRCGFRAERSPCIKAETLLFNAPKRESSTPHRTHGCFAHYIQAVPDNGDIFGDMDGKGVFLYATRGAKALLNELFSQNGIKIDDIDLLIEHQANFAMIPLTLEQVLDKDSPEIKARLPT